LRSPWIKATCPVPPVPPAPVPTCLPGVLSPSTASAGVYASCRMEIKQAHSLQTTTAPSSHQSHCTWSERGRRQFTIANWNSSLQAGTNPAQETDGEDVFQGCVRTHHRAAKRCSSSKALPVLPTLRSNWRCWDAGLPDHLRPQLSLLCRDQTSDPQGPKPGVTDS
jgi:hypothetical protein